MLVCFVMSGAKVHAVSWEWTRSRYLYGVAARSRYRKLQQEGRVRAVGTEGLRFVVHHT